MWVFTINGIHLVNQNGAPVAGGSPRLWYTTPFAVRDGWSPQASKGDTLYQGGGPFVNGSRPLLTTYPNVVESIPIAVVGETADDIAQALQQLKQELTAATRSAPAIWRLRPYGASTEAYAEIYGGTVQESADNDQVGPAEGGTDIDAVITLTRSPFFGSEDLQNLISAGAITNAAGSNTVSLGTVFGDLAVEGCPLNVTIPKPTSGNAAGVILATVYSTTGLTVGASQSTTSTTTGASFTATGSADVSALRSRLGLSLRILARLTTLTSPSTAEVLAEVQTAGGAALWRSDWTPLSTDTTAQIVDLGATPLDSVRVPLSSAANVKVVISIRSTTGASVGATLDYVELLLAYDYCVIESAGLATGESYLLYGAQNLNGGGWLPLVPEAAAVVDGSDVVTKPAKILGQLPRAVQGGSLYLGWYGSGRAHTKTDTGTVTADNAPLYRSLRGIT